MAKKILVVGGGGREHAIIKALKKSPDCGEVWCAPGNGGIGYDAHCVNIKATDVETMVGFAETEKFDYVVVAQDDPLALGMVDALAAVGSSYTLMVFLTSILLGLCMGSGVAISMQYGKRAQDSMRRSVFMSFLLIPQIGVTGIWVFVPIGWALADLIGFAAMRWHTL